MLVSHTALADLVRKVTVLFKMLLNRKTFYKNSEVKLMKPTT